MKKLTRVAVYFLSNIQISSLNKHHYLFIGKELVTSMG